MDETTMDPTAEDMELVRRLEAYAEARLSPSLTTEGRIRARVLAAAHRRADFARADAGLVLLPRPERPASADPGARGHDRRRAASALIAASLAASLFLGTALAAQPGGALYEVRLWAETMTLPSEPSARAVAELDRLADRLAEADAAGRSGDPEGASAALDAYESILALATSDAVEAGDVVAAAALEAGVARNIEVLSALAAELRAQPSAAIGKAIDRASERSEVATTAIERAHPANAGGPPGSAGAPGIGPQAGDDLDDADGGPTSRPVKPGKPTGDPVAEPTPAPRPDGTPAGGGRPPQPPSNGPADERPE